MTDHSIGIDIAKAHLDVFRMSDGAHRCFTNNKAGHKALIAWIGITDQRIIYEPTGTYHRALEQALVVAGLSCVKVNPRQARHLAEATGKHAKTDRMDAAAGSHGSRAGTRSAPSAKPNHE